MSNQASEDDQNKRDIIAALANDYYEQLKNDTPYINMTFEEAACTCRDFARQDVEDLLRTEKLKLLAEVRERVVGEDDYQPGNPAPDLVEHNQLVRDGLRFEQRTALNKLEAEL